ERAEQEQVEVRLVAWPIQVPDFRTRIHDLLTIPLASAPQTAPALGRGWAALKRAMDVAGAGLVTTLLAPFLALVAAAIKLDSKGPVFYRQVRLTRGGRPFPILKFRSMHTLADQARNGLEDANEASGPLFKIKDDPRVTRVGTWLRRFSL